jgi:hypothetical protein
MIAMIHAASSSVNAVISLETEKDSVMAFVSALVISQESVI